MKKIYKIIPLLIFNCVVLVIALGIPLDNCFSQQITFQKTFGGPNGNGGYYARQTSDGGYIIIGTNQGFSGAPGGVYLVKTDGNGDSLWTRVFGGILINYGRSVQQTSDGGYIITGYTENYGAGGGDVYLIRTDANGDSLWTKTFGGLYDDYGRSVQQTTDGGFIIAGIISILFAGDFETYLIKTDSNGDLVWSKSFTIAGSYSSVGYSVQQTADGGYILVGYNDSLAVNADIYLIKTDANGNLLWSKTYDASYRDYGNSVQQTADGGYIITGVTNINGYADVYLIKTDSIGGLIWTKTFGGTNYDEGFSVQQTADGGYIIVGYTVILTVSNCDIYLIRTDQNGDSLWTRTYGGAGFEQGLSVQQTTDGGYIILGQKGLGSIGAAYLIKTDSMGNTGCYQGNQATIVTTAATQVSSPGTIISSPATIETTPSAIISRGGIINTLCTTVGIPNLQSSPDSYQDQFSPNPLTTQSKLTFKNPDKQKFLFILYDITGRMTESVSTTANEIILTKGSKQPGVYLFNLVNEKTGERWNGKIIISN